MRLGCIDLYCIGWVECGIASLFCGSHPRSSTTYAINRSVPIEPSRTARRYTTTNDPSRHSVRHSASSCPAAARFELRLREDPRQAIVSIVEVLIISLITALLDSVNSVAMVQALVVSSLLLERLLCYSTVENSLSSAKPGEGRTDFLFRVLCCFFCRVPGDRFQSCQRPRSLASRSAVHENLKSERLHALHCSLLG